VQGLNSNGNLHSSFKGAHKGNTNSVVPTPNGDVLERSSVNSNLRVANSTIGRAGEAIMGGGSSH